MQNVEIDRFTMKIMDSLNEDQGTALLQEAPLRELISARVISRVIAVGGTGGFVLEVHFGERKALLASSRGSARTFASLSTVAVLMQRLGQACFEVDASAYVPGRVRAPQPERSAAMRAGKLPKTSPRFAKSSK
jgi:nitrate/nitrite transporter NarK